MLAKYQTIANTINRQLKLPRSLNFELTETLSGEEYSTFCCELLNAKFTILVSNSDNQVIVSSKDKIESLVYINDQWDCVVIGQKLCDAIQKWIDANLKDKILEIGSYGYKLKTIHRTGVFVFILIEYYNSDQSTYSQRTHLYSIHSEIGKKCLLLIDMIAYDDIVDLSPIPTLNQINPTDDVISNDSLGVKNELDYVTKVLMYNNYSKSFKKIL